MIESWQNLTKNKGLKGLYQQYINDLLVKSDHYNFVLNKYLLFNRENIFPYLPYTAEQRYQSLLYDTEYRKQLQFLSDCDTALMIIASIMIAPFNDLYVLMSAWSSNAPLTVYNAGNDHIINLYNFLIKNKLYTAYFPPINESHHTHCIDFSVLKNSVDVDDLIFQYQPDDSRKRLHELRLYVLLENVFLEMMNGRFLDEKELFALSSFQAYVQAENITEQELLQQLDLQHISKIVPHEYVKSRSSQFG